MWNGLFVGSDNILAWTLKEVFMTNAYLPCTLSETDVRSYQPVYYVTIKVGNGAGLWSDSQTSTPIIVVPEDITGNNNV